MIRWATEADRMALIALMRAVHDAAPVYDYTTMDGTVLVDDHHGTLRGYLRFFLGRPETWVRGFGVAAPYQRRGLVARRLLLALVCVAGAYGSQGIEGFQFAARYTLTEQFCRLGARVDAGQRVRFLVTPDVLTRWRV